MIFSRGSLGDLVAQSDGRPIYCIAAPTVSRALVGVVVDSFRRDFPNAAFVNARTLYRHDDDRRLRWARECESYGAGIVATLAVDCPDGADPFAGLAGEHAVSIWAAMEIDGLAYLGRPVGWHAVVFPATYWLSRFAVEPFDEMRTARYARLFEAAEAEPFHPIIGPSPFGVADWEA